MRSFLIVLLLLCVHIVITQTPPTPPAKPDIEKCEKEWAALLPQIYNSFKTGDFMSLPFITGTQAYEDCTAQNPFETMPQCMQDFLQNWGPKIFESVKQENFSNIKEHIANGRAAWKNCITAPKFELGDTPLPNPPSKPDLEKCEAGLEDVIPKFLLALKHGSFKDIPFIRISNTYEYCYAKNPFDEQPYCMQDLLQTLLPEIFDAINNYDQKKMPGIISDIKQSWSHCVANPQISAEKKSVATIATTRKVLDPKKDCIGAIKVVMPHAMMYLNHLIKGDWDWNTWQEHFGDMIMCYEAIKEQCF